MGLIIGTLEQTKEYFDSPAISQSYLKSLGESLQKYLEDKDKIWDTESTRIGRSVDAVLTGNREDFVKEFYVSELIKKPSDTVVGIIEYVLTYIINSREDVGTIGELNNYEEIILIACQEVNYGQAWKEETRISKIIEGGEKDGTLGSIYFRDLVNSMGKTVLSMSEHDKIKAVIQSLVKNPLTAPYFNRKHYFHSGTVDCYFQLPIFFRHNDEDCKALLDQLLVYRNSEGKINRVIPIDLKTMAEGTLKFTYSFKSWGYYIQSAWYTLAVQYWLESRDDVAEDVILENFRFVVESVNYPGTPLVYTVEDEILEIGKDGLRRVEENGVVLRASVRGYEQLIQKHKYYTNNDFSQEEIVEKTGGELKIGWNGIKYN